MSRKKRPDRAANARLRAEHEERMSKARITWAQAHRPPPPSAVTITTAVGGVRVEPALSAAELRRLVKDRPPISEGLRQRVLRRDNHACRYCGCDVGPFEMDHVLPVAMGGPTTYANLVTACGVCNRRKGAQVWQPMPLGRRLAARDRLAEV